MRTRGWQGQLPQTEEEARDRILAAAMRCVERHGAGKTTLADVAAEVGVTRQTVYKRFPSVADMLIAVGEAGANGFLERLTKHLADITDPADALVEAVAFGVEEIPIDPHIGLLLQAGEGEIFSRGATSSTAMSFGSDVLARLSVDWEAAGFDEERLTDLSEHMLRICLSLIQYPAQPPRDGKALRAYLRRWLAPVIEA